MDRKDKEELGRRRRGRCAPLQVDAPQVSGRGDGVALRAQLLVPLRWTERQRLETLPRGEASMTHWDSRDMAPEGIAICQSRDNT